MKVPPVIVIDFETKEIENRPSYPPVPVGFSIKWPKDRKSQYYAWGHPIENNCDKKQAERVLQEAWNSNLPLLFQNAKFDVDVAQTHMNCGAIDWERIHDTLYLIFLRDPHAQSYALKPAAERFLGMAPVEQEAVRNWLVQKGIVKKNDKKWGGKISEAPGKLVGAYADGDVIRTFKLFNFLYPSIVADDMLPAYNRERELMPILLQNEREGIRVNTKLLSQDAVTYRNSLDSADAWIRKRLQAPGLNVDSDEELAGLLDKHGIVENWVMTKTGKKSTAKKNLTVDMFNDAKLAQVLGYRNRLNTCLGTFILPWLEVSSKNGLIHTNWNQVRQNKADGFKQGTRTGRLSSNPNFQNIPNDFDDKGDGYKHPSFIKSALELPLMRKYILPDKNNIFLHRDYNQQELRILAHFEGGDLCRAYNEDPGLDIHNFVRDAIARVTSRVLDRKAIKILNFGIVYGMGLEKLASGTKTTMEDAKIIKEAHRKGVPGVAKIEKEIRDLGRAGEPIVTWGGRLYFTEPPKEIKGRLQSFEYKLLNYLIQGSAADCTKQAIINYSKIKEEGRFLVTVHDEMNISAPKNAAKREMKLLKEAMESVEFDVPMSSEGKGGVSWGELQKWKE